MSNTKHHLSEPSEGQMAPIPTFPFQEVKGPKKATGGRYFRIRIPNKLGKLIPWKIDETGDVAQHQVSKDLRMLVFQPLHKEIRVKNDRLAGVRRLLGDEHTAFCPPDNKRNKFIGWILSSVRDSIQTRTVQTAGKLTNDNVSITNSDVRSCWGHAHAQNIEKNK